MAYADINYYNDTYIGSPSLPNITPEEIKESNRLLERASEWIDRQTRDRILNIGDGTQADGLSKFNNKQQELIKKSNSAWVESTLQNGEVDVTNLDGTSFSLGDYSQSPQGNNASNQKAIYQRAFQFLDRTGLTYKGTCR